MMALDVYKGMAAEPPPKGGTRNILAVLRKELWAHQLIKYTVAHSFCCGELYLKMSKLPSLGSRRRILTVSIQHFLGITAPPRQRSSPTWKNQLEQVFTGENHLAAVHRAVRGSTHTLELEVVELIFCYNKNHFYLFFYQREQLVLLKCQTFFGNYPQWVASHFR